MRFSPDSLSRHDGGHVTMPPAGGRVADLLARDRIGVGTILFYVLAQVAPLTVAAGVLPTFWATTGITGAPIVFTTVGAVLGVFCLGYLGLARRLQHAGGIYPLVSLGIHRLAGAGTGMLAWGTYTCLQVALYGLLGPTLADLITQVGGPTLPWWIPSLAAWLLVAVLGVRDVRVSGTILAVLSAAEILLLLTLAVVATAHPAPSGVDTTTLNPHHLLAPGIGAALVIAVLGYVGFEGAPVLGEEARHPARTIPVATYTALAIMTGVYAVIGWAMATHYGPTHLATEATHGPGMVLGVAGGTLARVGEVLLATSMIAAALAFHTAVARITYTLSRDQLLPSVLGHTSARSSAPHAASAAQTLTGLLVIVGYAVSGTNPVTGLFYTLGTTGGLGVLLLITLASLAVVGHHLRHGTPQRALMPGIATLILGAMAWLAITGFPTLLGVDDTAILGRALPAALFTLLGVGVLLGVGLRRRDPRAYQHLGTPAVTTTVGSMTAPVGGSW